ncbi:MAG: hypothetical protein ABH883_04850 [Candidatus Omnitrophota bacterium]
MKKKILFTVIVMVLSAGKVCADRNDAPVPVRALIHLNSVISTGDYSPEQLVAMAATRGINAVFLTENLAPQWEYGLFPFRNIVKRNVRLSSLTEYGFDEYYRRLSEIEKQKQDMTVLMSAEVAPFYYWTGSPFGKEGLTLNDWDIQFIVAGMAPGDYGAIPTVSNGGFLYYGLKSFGMLWPFVLAASGIFFLKKKSSLICLPDIFCYGLILAGILFAAHYFPFTQARYDQYHGKAGKGPYQEVIDYVNSKGGMTFWSSPESSVDERKGDVGYAAGNAKKYMEECLDYTGFCCFYEGYRDIGGPGGVWDKLLVEYCGGGRAKPVWAIGEMSYHSKKDAGGKDIDEVQTVFIARANTRPDILEAMKNGRMYALRRSADLRLDLDHFNVEASDGKYAVMGQEILSRGPVKIHFGVSWTGISGDGVRAKLIRNGEIIKEFVLSCPGEFIFEDSFYTPGAKVYYRLDARGKYPCMLFSNPVFVRFKA